jgi:hypothetical protein
LKDEDEGAGYSFLKYSHALSSTIDIINCTLVVGSQLTTVDLTLELYPTLDNKRKDPTYSTGT